MGPRVEIGHGPGYLPYKTISVVCHRTASSVKKQFTVLQVTTLLELRTLLTKLTWLWQSPLADVSDPNHKNVVCARVRARVSKALLFHAFRVTTFA